MARIPSVTGRELMTALHKAGFQLVRVKGSHHYLRHPEGRTTVIPIHSGEPAPPVSREKC